MKPRTPETKKVPETAKILIEQFQLALTQESRIQLLGAMCNQFSLSTDQHRNEKFWKLTATYGGRAYVSRFTEIEPCITGIVAQILRDIK